MMKWFPQSPSSKAPDEKGSQDKEPSSRAATAVDRTGITFISTGSGEIVTAVGIFIKKKNILNLVSVYVSQSQKVICD